tara:strand:- start:247 stop:2463 length:2217 start_codon:yes stop_codon:yes gene_type:complete
MDSEQVLYLDQDSRGSLFNKITPQMMWTELYSDDSESTIWNEAGMTDLYSIKNKTSELFNHLEKVLIENLEDVSKEQKNVLYSYSFALIRLVTRLYLLYSRKERGEEIEHHWLENHSMKLLTRLKKNSSSATIDFLILYEKAVLFNSNKNYLASFRVCNEMESLVKKQKFHAEVGLYHPALFDAPRFVTMIRQYANVNAGVDSNWTDLFSKSRKDQEFLESSIRGPWKLSVAILQYFELVAKNKLSTVKVDDWIEFRTNYPDFNSESANVIISTLTGENVHLNFLIPESESENKLRDIFADSKNLSEIRTKGLNALLSNNFGKSDEAQFLLNFIGDLSQNNPYSELEKPPANHESFEEWKRSPEGSEKLTKPKIGPASIYYYIQNDKQFGLYRGKDEAVAVTINKLICYTDMLVANFFRISKQGKRFKMTHTGVTNEHGDFSWIRMNEQSELVVPDSVRVSSEDFFDIDQYIRQAYKTRSKDQISSKKGRINLISKILYEAMKLLNKYTQGATSQAKKPWRTHKAIIWKPRPNYDGECPLALHAYCATRRLQELHKKLVLCRIQSEQTSLYQSFKNKIHEILDNVEEQIRIELMNLNEILTSNEYKKSLLDSNLDVEELYHVAKANYSNRNESQEMNEKLNDYPLEWERVNGFVKPKEPVDFFYANRLFPEIEGGAIHPGDFLDQYFIPKKLYELRTSEFPSGVKSDLDKIVYLHAKNYTPIDFVISQTFPWRGEPDV